MEKYIPLSFSMSSYEMKLELIPFLSLKNIFSIIFPPFFRFLTRKMEQLLAPVTAMEMECVTQ
jgi:hypothetical protein